jgi:hypothetical protein
MLASCAYAPLISVVFELTSKLLAKDEVLGFAQGLGGGILGDLELAGIKRSQR